MEFAPELVLLVILPPLIYSAGVAMSWREFRFNLRPITLLAVGCVVFTTCAVALATHLLLGLPWTIGFVLGAIVAPPDTVAPLAIARRLGLPRRLLVVLEGEGLANDATALVLYRFAVAAAVTGAFSLPVATGEFALIVVGEIAFGLGVGWVSLRLRHWAQEPRVEIVLSLMTPYLAYWVPEHLGGSGVLATVATGLYVSWNGPRLIPSATRLQGIFFWDLIVYLIEGFVFLLTGLQARTLVDHMHGFSAQDAAVATLLVCAVIIAARFVWVFPAVYLPRWLVPPIKRRDPAPPWTWAFMLAFTGIRGVVSLAAALALPFTLANGEPFPYRDLILYITFGVIIITLVGQGSMMPRVIRWLGLAQEVSAERRREREAELKARFTAIDAAEARLAAIATERQLPDGMAALLRERDDLRRNASPRTLTDGLEAAQLNAELRLELIKEERKVLHRELREGHITDESRRRLERELDLEEAAIVSKETDPPL
jgi:CPA1 family monovalent cation:H+ antiporter